MNMTLIETIQPSTGYGDYDSDYSDECNNDDIMQVVQTDVEWKWNSWVSL